MLFNAGKLPTHDHGSRKYDSPATWKLKPTSTSRPNASMIARTRPAGVRRFAHRYNPTTAMHGKPRYAPFSESLPRNRSAISSVQCQLAHVRRVGTTRFARSAGKASGELTPPDWKRAKK